MSMWIFSNQGYGFGEDILAEAVRVASVQGMRYHVVISTKNIGKKYKQRKSLLNLVGGFLSVFIYQFFIVIRLKLLPIFVEDINAKAFQKRIEPGDIGVIAGFDQIFKDKSIARFGALVNFHPSLLPLYRGANPSYWCLANHETMSGFTIHKVTKSIDAGPILYQQMVPVGGAETVAELDMKISRAALPLVEPVVAHMLGEKLMPSRVLDAYQIYKAHMGYISGTTSSAKKDT